MTTIASDREFNLVRDSFSTLKKINLRNIGLEQISNSNLYIYQSDEYNILSYSVKPQLIFSIKSEEDGIHLKLKRIKIKNLPSIFERLQLTLEVNIFPEKGFCKIYRHISLKYDSKNKLVTFISKNFIDKILLNLIEVISARFDKKLIKKVIKEI